LNQKEKSLDKESHEALVNETYQARAKAGIAGKETEEKTMLSAQADEVLKLFKSDAEKTASLTASVSKQAPKVPFTAKATNDLAEAINQKRAELGFAPIKE